MDLLVRVLLVLGLTMSVSARAQNDLIWNTDSEHPASAATTASNLPFTTNVTHEGIGFEFTTEFVGSSIPAPSVLEFVDTRSTWQLLAMQATQGGSTQCIRTTMEVVNSAPDFSAAFLENLEVIIEDADLGSGSSTSPNFWQDIILLEGLYEGTAQSSTTTLGGVMSRRSDTGRHSAADRAHWY